MKNVTTSRTNERFISAYMKQRKRAKAHRQTETDRITDNMPLNACAWHAYAQQKIENTTSNH